MTTIGYGDITPQSVYEGALLMFGMVVATFTYAAMINLIGEIVQEIS